MRHDGAPEDLLPSVPVLPLAQPRWITPVVAVALGVVHAAVRRLLPAVAGRLVDRLLPAVVRRVPDGLLPAEELRAAGLAD